MEVYHDSARFPRPAVGSAVTIGAYDGVHLGHRIVIADVCRLADERGGLTSVVVTFDRHPASVVRPDSAPRLLTDLQQKLELLDSTGIDAALVIRFDEARSLEPPEEFVTEVLVKALAAKLVVVGRDFHFGHRRRGDVALLTRMGREHGFDVIGVELQAAPGSGVAEPVSSTSIRHALLEGRVEEAARLLGRPHEVRGIVMEGDRRGRDLGFPTANVAVAGDILLPADGIYAGRFVRADGTVHPAAINLGKRPTFYDAADSSLLEAHLLDFDGDLYGESAAVRFEIRLRGEVKFPSAEALVEQMVLDVEAARAALA